MNLTATWALLWALAAATSCSCWAQTSQPDLGPSFSLSQALREQATRQPSATGGAPPTARPPPTPWSSTPSETRAAVEQTRAGQTQPAASTEPTSSRFQFVQPLLAPRCNYNNRSYSVGQRWNDDCLQVCECILAEAEEASREQQPLAVSACRARCPTYKDPPGDGCQLQRSPTDECCLEWKCSLEAKFAPQDRHQTTTTTVIQTERGQLNVSTTEIKMPEQVVAATETITTTTAAAATTTTTTTTTTPKPTASQQKKVIQQQQPKVAAATTATQRQVPSATTLPPATTSTSAATTTLAATTTSRRPAGQPATTGGQRAPKAERAGLGASPGLGTQRAPLASPPPPRDLRTLSEELLDRTAPPSPEEDDKGPTESRLASQEVFVDPLKEDLCIQSPESGYKLHDEWTVEPCNVTCRCVFQAEPKDPINDIRFFPAANLRLGSARTETRCGLPSHCQHLLSRLTTPTPECPRPQLVVPQQSADACTCPEITCSSRSIQQQMPPPAVAVTTTTTAASQPPTTVQPAAGLGCKSTDRLLAPGETFNDECHSVCRCSADGKIRCEPLVCPSEPASGADGCPKWVRLAEPASSSNSSTSLSSTTSSDENRCCPQFVCERPEEPPAGPRSCLLLNRKIAHGERVPEQIQGRENVGNCDSSCTCHDGKIVCQPSCVPLSEQPPDELDCAPGEAYPLDDGCCLVWACPLKENYSLEDFQARALNATSVELSFVLPLFAIGFPGSFKLNYTHSSAPEAHSQPPAEAHWMVKNIRTVDGNFTNRLTKYFLNDLKPSHRYWFQGSAKLRTPDPLMEQPLVGQLQSLVMPSLGASEAPAPAPPPPTPTTTAPSTIIIKPISSTPVGSRLLPAATTSAAITATTTTTTTTSPPPTTTTTTTTTAAASSTTTTARPSTTTTAAAATTTTTTTTTTTSSTTRDLFEQPALKDPQGQAPCPPGGPFDGSSNRLDEPASQISMPLIEALQAQMNGPVQRYAWHLLVAFSIMTILFAIMSCLYLKKSTRAIASITAQPGAYDNPTFTKLVSYYANQPPHVLLVDENSQNFNNDAILAIQKNLEVDKSSPLRQANNNNNHHHHNLNHNHHHRHRLPGDIEHPNGRQRLI